MVVRCLLLYCLGPLPPKAPGGKGYHMVAKVERSARRRGCPWTPPLLCAVLQLGGIVVSLPAGDFRGRGPSPVYKEPVYDLGGGSPAFGNTFHNQGAKSEKKTELIPP